MRPVPRRRQVHHLGSFGQLLSSRVQHALSGDVLQSLHFLV